MTIPKSHINSENLFTLLSVCRVVVSCNLIVGHGAHTNFPQRRLQTSARIWIIFAYWDLPAQPKAPGYGFFHSSFFYPRLR